MSKDDQIYSFFFFFNSKQSKAKHVKSNTNNNEGCNLQCLGVESIQCSFCGVSAANFQQKVKIKMSLNWLIGPHAGILCTNKCSHVIWINLLYSLMFLYLHYDSSRTSSVLIFCLSPQGMKHYCLRYKNNSFKHRMGWTLNIIWGKRVYLDKCEFAHTRTKVETLWGLPGLMWLEKINRLVFVEFYGTRVCTLYFTVSADIFARLLKTFLYWTRC